MRPLYNSGSFARAAALVAALAVLGACAANDTEKALTDAATVAPKSSTLTAADFVKSTYCPPLQLRAGTETMKIYQRGHDGEADFIRNQASITDTARECTASGNTLSIKVGVRGRVVAGPKGGAGSVTLPIRVAVVKQTAAAKPLYSHLFKVPVSVTGPTFGATYNQVFDQVTVQVSPEDRDLIVFVGFDEGS